MIPPQLWGCLRMVVERSRDYQQNHPYRHRGARQGDFLFCVLCARRRSEVANLRGSDLRRDGEKGFSIGRG